MIGGFAAAFDQHPVPAGGHYQILTGLTEANGTGSVSPLQIYLLHPDMAVNGGARCSVYPTGSNVSLIHNKRPVLSNRSSLLKEIDMHTINHMIST